MGWEDSLFSPPKSADAFGRTLVRGRKDNAFGKGKCSEFRFQDSIQKGQIFIKLSGVGLVYTHYIENGHPEGSKFLEMRRK